MCVLAFRPADITSCALRSVDLNQKSPFGADFEFCYQKRTILCCLNPYFRFMISSKGFSAGCMGFRRPIRVSNIDKCSKNTLFLPKYPENVSQCQSEPQLSVMGIVELIQDCSGPSKMMKTDLIFSIDSRSSKGLATGRVGLDEPENAIFSTTSNRFETSWGAFWRPKEDICKRI